MFKQTSPLVKQLAGAAGGTLIALVLYGAYSVASPVVHTLWSSLVSPVEATSKFTEQDRVARRAEIVERARGIVEREVGEVQ